MPNNITHKTSTTASAVPTAAQLAAGELAVNAAAGKVYTRKTDGTVVDLTDLQIMDGGEQFTPAAVSNLAMWFDASDTASLYTSEVGSVTAVTAPTDITGCVGWWDGADATTMFDATSGGNQVAASGAIARWQDKSGTARHATQATAGSRPVLTSAGLNGRSVVTFDGTDDHLQFTGVARTDETWFVVARANVPALGTNKEHSFIGDSVSTGASYGFSAVTKYDGGTGVVYAALGGFVLGTTRINSPTIPNNVPAGPSVYSLVRSAAAGGVLRINGVLSGTCTTSNSFALATIGRNTASSSPNGYIAEIIVYNSALSDAQRARVEKYLANKWGFSDPHQSVTQATSAISSPTDIVNCALWLDASDSSSVTLSSGVVTQWNDKSGNARHFTATSTACPTYAATINSRSVLTFDGVANTLTGNAAAQTVIQNLTGYTCFVVARINTVAVVERFIFGIGSANVIYRIGHQDSRPFIGGRRTGAETLRSVTAASGTLVAGNTYVLSSTVNHVNTTLTGFSRGTTFGTDSAYMDTGSSPATAQAVNVGTQGGGSYGYFSGDVAEVIMYSTALSDTDRARVEKYLANKWGGTSGIEPTPAIGAWFDKSGNSRNITQATAANRPAIHGSLQNNLRVVSFDGTNDGLFSTTGGQALKTGATVIAAMFSGANNYASVLCVGEAPTGGGRWVTGLSGTTFGVDYYTNALAGSASLVGQNRTAVFTAAFDVALNQITLRLTGAQTAAQSRLSPALVQYTSDAFSVGTVPPANEQWFVGRIFELMAFSRVLTATEMRRIETYLASKWGITTFAPQVSNLDAQDWINRVYFNGGSVSQGTAAAVNNFCNAIDSAGLRDRFYRLNLFCGNDLTSCLVPLYRGPSLTTTQRGNATDTNNSFIAGDYAETGSSGGLLGNGSTKYLNTGLNANVIPDLAQSGHLSVYAAGSFSGQIAIGVYEFTNPPFVITHESEIQIGATAANNFINSSANGGTPSYSSPVFVMGSRTSSTNLIGYANGVGGTATTATANLANPALPFFVFARNLGGGPAVHFGHRLRAYSIGEGLTAAQALSYNNAMQTFQAALSRAV